MGKARVRVVEKISESVLTSSNAIKFDWRMSEAFPDVDPGMKPFGNLCMVQIRRPKKFTTSGFELTATDRATEYYNTQIAKVLAVGNLAFSTVRNIDGEEKIFAWPEGDWFKPGDFVRVPRYGGDRFTVKATVKEIRKLIGQTEETEFDVEDDIVFAMFKSRDIQALVTGSPFAIGAFHD